MRRIVLSALPLILVLIISGIYYLTRQTVQDEVPMDDLLHIQLGSDPFPLVVGQDTLLVKLTRNGEPVDGATVEVEATRQMQGQIPVYASTNRSEEGVYTMDVIWPSTDRWTINVTARLGSEEVDDYFIAWVFAVPEENMSTRETYVSMKSIESAQAANPNEYWIIIPQGTASQIREGHGDDVMPTEIRLYVDGQNTLVLRNNDLADHTIGPFFVRAGEMLRQTFSSPQVYEGVCSVRHDSTVRIIVE